MYTNQSFRKSEVSSILRMNWSGRDWRWASQARGSLGKLVKTREDLVPCGDREGDNERDGLCAGRCEEGVSKGSDS